jgi:glucosamine-6-phosphate isomerase
MKVVIFEDYQELSEQAVLDIIAIMIRKPTALICFASGDSPKLTCALLVQKIKEQQIDISQCSFIELDEWVGLAPDIKGSCHYDFMHRLAIPLNLTSQQCHLFDGLSKNLQEECALMDAFIESRGGIDIMIVGVGMNGHIGFNEPEVDFGLRTHVIPLDEITAQVGQKYFDHPVTLTKGITVGLGYLMEAHKVLLLANGARKAPIIHEALQGPVTSSIPASIMQIHPEGFVYVDKEAGSLLHMENL